MNTVIPDPINSVADESWPALAAVKKNIGFVPNLFTAIGASPEALNSFVSLNTDFDQSSLTPAQQQVVLIAVSVENECTYCAAGHTLFARSVGVSDDVINAVRNGAEMADVKLNTLQQFARQLVRRRGKLEQSDLGAFYGAGFDQRQLLEVVLGVVLKTFSNYAAIMLQLPLDKQFEAGAWHVTEQAA